ncbi:hypothetical protein BSKO_02714 [Bryopsis sp. KO-2023]|nr:hypothetical protein BSKO_02714 [Bryopsis sp. KO-2023]
MMRSMTLWEYATLNRGDEVRCAKLAHMRVFEVQNFQPHTPKVLMLYRDNSKTMGVGVRGMNKPAPDGYHAIQHTQPERCPVNALGIYLMERFMIRGESYPDMLEEPPLDAWRKTPLWASAHGDQLPYSTHLSYDTKAQKAVGVHIRAKTHSKRKGGAQEAHNQGAGHDDLTLHGGWSQTGKNVLHRAYLDRAKSVARESLLALGGHLIGDGSVFYLPRAQIEPPPQLRNLLFPWVNDKLKKDVAHCAATLRDHPTYCHIYEHPRIRHIFHDPLFDEFALRVRNADRTTVASFSPAMLRIGVCVTTARL